MTRISQDELEYLRALINRDPQKALQVLLSYERKYVNDMNLAGNSGGFFIDIGSHLGDTNLVERGIASIGELLPSVGEDSRPLLLYNLANGHASLHYIARRQPDFSFDPDDTPLREAKRRYRDALAGLEHLDPNQRCGLLVNYGNCLSSLGRSLEAISEYNAALSHAPDHPMAWGNLGVELEHFALVACDSAVLRDASIALSRALADDRLEQMGESWARRRFARTQDRVARYLAIINEHTRAVAIETPAFATAYEQAYADFCVGHHLFLNFCLENRPCEHMAADTVSLRLITALDDNTTYPRLARVVNEIKERYAAARMLLFEACNPPYDSQPYDEMTYYADNLDYAVYGIRPTKLKVAFEEAYNILDRIAFFINDYLDLGIGEHLVNFASVWKEAKTASLRPEVAQSDNYHLFGLYDISRDLGSGGYVEHLRRIRNHVTHRYLVLHVERMHWLTSADSPEYHSGYRELLDRTIELMRLVRSAVIYLIAFIDQEERRRRQDSERRIAPMRVPPSRPYPVGPQEAPI